MHTFPLRFSISRVFEFGGVESLLFGPITFSLNLIKMLKQTVNSKLYAGFHNKYYLKVENKRGSVPLSPYKTKLWEHL